MGNDKANESGQRKAARDALEKQRVEADEQSKEAVRRKNQADVDEELARLRKEAEEKNR